jgi:uncharacterized protein (DUF934 family)
MALLKPQGFVEDDWTFLADDQPPPSSGDIVVSFARLARDWDALVNHDGRLGVVFPNSEREEALRIHLPRLQLVVLNFPAFSDGRAYSIARQLRLEGFAGELRATGNVLPDQLQFMLQVGFDSAEVNDRFPRDYWLSYLRRMTLTYQHDLADGRTPHPAASVWIARQSAPPPPDAGRKANGAEK